METSRLIFLTFVIFHCIQIAMSRPKLNGNMFSVFDREETTDSLSEQSNTALDTYSAEDAFFDFQDRDLGLLPYQIKTDVVVILDALFKAKHGNQSENAFRKHLEVAQSFLYWPSLQVRVKINVVGYQYSTGEFNSSEKALTAAGKETEKISIDADAYLFMSVKTGYRGVGSTWTKAACYSDKKNRTLVVAEQNAAQTPQMIARLFINHLGATWDFAYDENSTWVPRKDDPNGICFNGKGFMNAVDKPTTWSECTVRDITGLYKNLTIDGNQCMDTCTEDEVKQCATYMALCNSKDHPGCESWKKQCIKC